MGNVERRSFDLLGRVTSVATPDGDRTDFAYNAEGSVVRAKNSVHDVQLTYVGTGRLATRTEAGSTIRFDYDTEEELIAVVNPDGLTHRMRRDSAGRVVREVSYDGVYRHYTYDVGGRVVRVDRPEQRFEEYERDSVGRTTEIRFSDGEVERFSYRADSEMMTASNQNTSIVYERDLLGNVTRESQGKHWVSTEFDILGNAVRVTSSHGADRRIERDQMSAAAVVSEGQSRICRFDRDQLGRVLELELPGGLRSRWQRDALGRPQMHELLRGTSALRAFSYQWGMSDRLDAVIDAFAGPVRYKRDARGYLASATLPSGVEEVRVPDSVQNIFRTAARRDRSYGAGGELLESRSNRGSTQYIYDCEGSLIRKAEANGRVWTYEWSVSGYLKRVTRPDGTEVVFQYDPLGRRISKTFRGQTTRWVWHGDVPLHEWVEGGLEPLDATNVVPVWSADAEIKRRDAELSAHLAQGPPWRGTPTAPLTYVFEPDGLAPLAIVSGNEVRTIVTDHLGAPCAMFDGQGHLVWSATLDSYGRLRSLNGQPASACPFRWPGQYEDAETGLYYNRFRYYDPDSGTYISRDPIGLDGGLAHYSYVHDPSTYFDFFGLADGGSYSSVRSTPRGIPRLVSLTLDEAMRPRDIGCAVRRWTRRAIDIRRGISCVPARCCEQG